MKKLLFFFLLPLVWASCDKSESLSNAQRSVVSNATSIPFEELLLLVNLKTTSGEFVVVEAVDSVNLYINNVHWAKSNSQSLDIAKLPKQEVGNKFISSRKVNYLVVAKRNLVMPDLSTAGEFADYLNAVYELKPGEYACWIESFQLTFNDGSTKTYYPFTYAPFRVEENNRSAFVGEIELIID